MEGPGFALLSAATWGSGDFFGGLASRLGGLRPTLVLTQLFGVLLALSLVPLAGESPPTAEGFLWAAGGGAAGVIGVGCLYRALAAGTMGLVAPLTGLIAAAIPAVIGIVSGDPVGPILLAGILVALVSVVVISLPGRSGSTSAAVGPRQTTNLRDWALIACAGLGFASFYLLVDRAHAAGSGTAYTLVAVRASSTLLAVAVLLPALVAGEAGPRPTRRIVGLTFLTGLGDTGGNLFYIIATSVGTLSVTVVLASLYPVSTALWARVVLRERLSRPQLAGVVLAVAGALLISAGSLGT